MLKIFSPQINSPSLTGKISLECDTEGVQVILTRLGPRITKKPPVPSSSWSSGPGDVAMLQPPSARHPPCRSRGWFFPSRNRGWFSAQHQTAEIKEMQRGKIFLVSSVSHWWIYNIDEVKLEYVDVWVMLKSFFDTRKFGDQWSFIVGASSLFSKTVCEIILMVWIKNWKSSRREGIDIDCPQIQFRPDSNLV